MNRDYMANMLFNINDVVETIQHHLINDDIIGEYHEDQAFDRAIAYDEDKSWALGTWDEGVNDQSHAGTEEVDD